MSGARAHFLLLRFSSLGDVVLQTSVVQWLKATYGQNLSITFVTSHEFKDLVLGHPDIQRVITFDRKGGERLADLAQKIRGLHAEFPITLMLDLHATTRSTLLRWRLWDLPRLVVDKRRLERWLLVRLPGKKPWTYWKFLGLEPQVKRVPLDWRGLLMAQPLEGKEPLTFTPLVAKMAHARPYVVFAPVASFVSKRWPMESFVALARQFLAEERWREFDLVIIAGPDDHHCRAFDEIQDARLLNLQGKTKLAESTAWVQGARLVVGNDSGMNHLAEAGGVPVITLFGPTHEAFGFAPHLSRSRALSLEPWCRPCSATGARPCFRDTPVCLTELSPETVRTEMSRVLESA